MIHVFPCWLFVVNITANTLTIVEHENQWSRVWAAALNSYSNHMGCLGYQNTCNIHFGLCTSFLRELFHENCSLHSTGLSIWVATKMKKKGKKLTIFYASTVFDFMVAFSLTLAHNFFLILFIVFVFVSITITIYIVLLP